MKFFLKIDPPTATAQEKKVSIRKGKPIFYNLGNFIFDQSNPATHRSYFLNLDLVEDNCTVTLYPTYLSNYLPHFMDAESGKALINVLNPHTDVSSEVPANFSAPSSSIITGCRKKY